MIFYFTKKKVTYKRKQNSGHSYLVIFYANNSKLMSKISFCCVSFLVCSWFIYFTFPFDIHWIAWMWYDSWFIIYGLQLSPPQIIKMKKKKKWKPFFEFTSLININMCWFIGEFVSWWFFRYCSFYYLKWKMHVWKVNQHTVKK